MSTGTCSYTYDKHFEIWMSPYRAILLKLNTAGRTLHVLWFQNTLQMNWNTPNILLTIPRLCTILFWALWSAPVILGPPHRCSDWDVRSGAYKYMLSYFITASFIYMEKNTGKKAMFLRQPEYLDRSIVVESYKCNSLFLS